jgi:hypothetical protein
VFIAEQVYLVGSFNNWSDMIPMHWDGGDFHVADLELPRGEYFYQYLVNGRTMLDSWKPTESSEQGRPCNKISVA